MNIKKAISNFEILKTEVLRDGKVDEEEVKILLEFLEPYTKTYSENFSKLKSLLVDSNINGLNPKKSHEIAEELEKSIAFLKTEQSVERFLGWFAVTFVFSFFIYLLLH